MVEGLFAVPIESQIELHCSHLSSAPVSRWRKQLGRRRSPEQRAAEIRTAISENLANPYVSLNFIAKECGISSRHLATIMRRYGSTYSAELMEQRLNVAKLMLQKGSGLLMKQVAYDTGFKSAAHFSAAYKRRFGHAPRFEEVSRERDEFATRLPEESRAQLPSRPVSLDRHLLNDDWQRQRGASAARDTACLSSFSLQRGAQ